jgi:RND family efflux transporter MFP subunit
MSRKTLLVIGIAAALSSGLSACGKGGQAAKPDASASATASLLIAPEDLLKVTTNALASGPVITGSILPERNADLRAEVSAVVIQVLKENGEAVRRGDVLVRLDETAIRDGLTSADEATRAAAQSLDQSERQFQRMKTLRTSGMTSTQSVEDAEIKRNNAQSDLAAAKSRSVQARQQLDRTVVRAPFDGVVSERKTSNGDTAAIGKELIKVIDPTSMRFEGLVGADKVGAVKVGQAVRFAINGYPNQTFVGKVKRIDPAADAVTRQVPVLVEFVETMRPRVSGLYAEGRIESDSVPALMIPESAMVVAGDKSYAWRLKDKTLQKVTLSMGLRDERSGLWEVRGGVVAGDLVLRNPGSNLKDGQKIDLATPATASLVAAKGK